MARSPVQRSYTARDVFKSAIGFDKTCDYLNALDHKNNPSDAAFMGHPIIAMSALSIELLLKTLHALHSDNPIPGLHDLGALYRGLSQTDRIAVQKRWVVVYKEWHERLDQMRAITGVGGTTPKKVEAALEEGAKAFKQARYNFEPGSKHFNYYLDYMRKPLVRLVLERQPEFGVWQLQTAWSPWDHLAASQTAVPKETT